MISYKGLYCTHELWESVLFVSLLQIHGTTLVCKPNQHDQG